MRKNVSEIARALRQEIESGAYKAHDRLPPSRVMAETLGVARNTLRQALFQLEKQGLVEIRAGSGTYVSDMKQDPTPAALAEITPLELMDARFAIEPHICRLCVLNGRLDDWEKLNAVCEQLEAVAHDPEAFSKIDTEFHKLLAQTTRNNLLIWLIDHINTVRSNQEWTRMLSITLDENIIRIYNVQHREIVKALQLRQPELAAKKMKEHLETARLSLTRAAEA